jgi:hypothetical protein
MVALHVGPRVLEDVSNISSRVSDGDLARYMLRDVVLEIALDSLNIVSNHKETRSPSVYLLECTSDCTLLYSDRL